MIHSPPQNVPNGRSGHSVLALVEEDIKSDSEHAQSLNSKFKVKFVIHSLAPLQHPLRQVWLFLMIAGNFSTNLIYFLKFQLLPSCKTSVRNSASPPSVENGGAKFTIFLQRVQKLNE